MRINTVTVIGANGTMGCNVAGIFASFGNAKVYMVCRDLEAANKAKDRASVSVKAEVIADNLIPKTYDDLEECISESDLVFESVVEDANIKKSVYEKFRQHLKPNTIIGTGTSGLSINQLSEYFDENIKQNFMGIHFYNPPYNMTLCELIPHLNSDEELINSMKVYLEDLLFRDVVVVKDEPAFMGNRIGFQFINEAMQYADLYKESGGIDYIDAILGPFTGRSMAPLTTSDFVGLDVHKAIVDNIHANTEDYAHESFVFPEYALRLVSEGNFGRKSGAGLYKMVVDTEGKKVLHVYDISTGKYRPKEKYGFPFANHMVKEFKVGNYNRAFELLSEDQSIEATICAQFLVKYVLYGLTTTKLIAEDIRSADTVMATGFNWVPPLAVIDAFGGSDAFKKVAYDKLDKDFIESVNIESILENVPESKFDYRPFFKAR